MSQGQYDYLKSLMNDMSMGDLGEAVGHYSGLQYSLGNALAIMGDPNVQTATGDRGGMSSLPPDVQKAFTDPLLRVSQDTFKKLATSGDRGFDPRVLFSHWNDYQTLSNLMNNANPALMNGNAINNGLLTKMGETLGVTHSTGPWSAEAQALSAGMTGQIENVLTTAGHDQTAVHDVVTSERGQAFIADFVTQHWDDNGTALAGLLPDTVDHTANAGETMHAFDQYVGENADTTLMNMPGTENESLGQVNPEFVKALAHANTPYVDDMLGNDLDGTQGFSPLDPLTNPQMPNTRDLFAVIDTNPDAAATLNSQAYLNGLQYQNNFEQSIIKGDLVVDSGDLMSAGTLRGVIDSAASAADNDAIEYGNLKRGQRLRKP